LETSKYDHISQSRFWRINKRRNSSTTLAKGGKGMWDEDSLLKCMKKWCDERSLETI